MIDPERVQTKWVNPWTVSVALHLVILIPLVAWLLMPRPTGPGNASAAAASVVARAELGQASAKSEESQKAETANQVETLFDHSVAQAQALTPRQQFNDISRHADKLEALSSAKSMVEIGSLVQKTLKLSPRAYAPTDRPPRGEFDATEALIHSIKRRADAKGEIKAFYVLVDKEGRTRELEVPPDANTLGLAVWERLQQSPVLRQLKDQILLPTLNAKLSSTGK